VLLRHESSIRGTVMIVLAVAILSSLGAASVGYAQTSGGTFIAAMTTEPPELDPYVGGTAANRNIGHHVFESLVTYDENYQLIPQIAASWDISDDGVTYTFHLREGVRFHDGTELTAGDVKASLERFRDIGFRAADFATVQAIDAVDDHTVRIVIEQPEGAFLAKLANPGVLLGMMPASQAASREALRPPDLIGTGPYRIAEWVPGQHVRLVRFDDYTPNEAFEATGLGGHRIAYFDEVRFVPVPEPGSRTAGLETGEYQYAEGVPVTSYRRVQQDPNIRAHILAPRWKVNINFNHRDSIFSDVRARRAMVAALDMDDVLSVITSGVPEFQRAQPSLFFNEQATWHSDVGDDVYNRRDPELARQLFAEAGYQGEELVMATNRDFDWMYKAALAIQEQLREIDVNLRLDVYDWAAQRAKTQEASGWDIGSDGKSMRLDPNDYNTAFLCGTASAFGYCSDEMDALVRGGAAETDIERRQDIYRDLQRLMWDDVPWLPLGDIFELEATRANVEGYRSWYTPRFWNVSFE
jgi:peptide/nickel transport system substrate-binding protein